MKKLCLLILITLSLAGYAVADGCGWPYNCVGQIAPTMNVTAYVDGPIIGQYVGYSANFTDYVRVKDITQNWTSDWLIQNQLTNGGVFGIAKAGDNLVVQICAVPNWLADKSCHTDPDIHIFASDPSFSEDATNHAYFSQVAVNQPFWYVGMEDLSQAWSSDWDYNDLEFELINVTVTPAGKLAVTPEPASMVLLGTGLIAAVRRIRKA